MRIILHIDMDSFFTSVEEREKPELKGKPVVVGADPKQGKGRGVVSTASYPARKFGIRSAMPISQAWKANPKAIFLPVDMPKYIEASGQVMSRLRKFSGKFEQVSIDEAYLDVSSSSDDFEKAAQLAMEIQKEVVEKEKLSCSIGVGPNKLIAKIASDFRKPAGLTVVRGEEVKDFLSPLPAIKIPGIGPKTNERLKQLGMATIGELASMPKNWFIEEFGKFGIYLFEAANGIDSDEVEESYGVKSINRNITFEQDTLDLIFMHSVIDEMAADIEESLLSEGLLFKTLTLRVRYSNFDTHTKAQTMDSHSSGKEVMSLIAKELLKPFIGKRLIRQLGLRVSSLKEKETKQKSVTDFF